MPSFWDMFKKTTVEKELPYVLPVQPRGGSISGKVYESGYSERGLNDVNIKIFGKGVVVKQGKTDTLGQFHISGLLDGNYTATFEKSNYQSAMINVRPRFEAGGSMLVAMKKIGG